MERAEARLRRHISEKQARHRDRRCGLSPATKSSEQIKKQEDAGKSRKSLFNWIWWLLFPVALYLYHSYQDSQKPEPLVFPTETYKTRHDSLQRVREIMTDSAHLNRGMREMKEKHERKSKSLKERVNELKERHKEDK